MQVREAFREMDLDHNMQLDGNELRGCLERYGFAINGELIADSCIPVQLTAVSPATEFKLLMKQIDKNGDGKIDVAEFTSQFGDAVLPMEVPMTTPCLHSHFPSSALPLMLTVTRETKAWASCSNRKPRSDGGRIRPDDSMPTSKPV